MNYIPHTCSNIITNCILEYIWYQIICAMTAITEFNLLLKLMTKYTVKSKNILQVAITHLSLHSSRTFQVVWQLISFAWTLSSKKVFTVNYLQQVFKRKQHQTDRVKYNSHQLIQKMLPICLCLRTRTSYCGKQYTKTILSKNIHSSVQSELVLLSNHLMHMMWTWKSSS